MRNQDFNQLVISFKILENFQKSFKKKIRFERKKTCTNNFSIEHLKSKENL